MRQSPHLFSPRGAGEGDEKTSSVSHSLDSFPVREEAVNPVGADAPGGPCGAIDLPLIFSNGWGIVFL